MGSKTAFNVLVLLASGAFLAGSRVHPSGPGIAIDTAFLDELASLPPTGTLTEEQRVQYGRLIWDHEEELRYLARTNEPRAVAVIVRLMARGSVPGGCCCCSGAFDETVCHGGLSGAFWRALEALDEPTRAKVLRRVDTVGYTEANASSCWDDDRRMYLEQNAGVAAAYLALVKAPE